MGDIEIDKDEIKRINMTKYLGLTKDESLSWSQQYKVVKGKLKSGLTSIRKLREIILQSKLFLVYQALVESHLRYGNLICGHSPQKKLCELQKIQNRVFCLTESAPIKDRIPSAPLNVEKLLHITGP